MPELSMLWESDDPRPALTRRFGFGDPAEAVAWLRIVLAEHWGLELTSCERLVISAGNILAWSVVDGRRVIAKWSVVRDLFPRLAALDRLTTWLADRGQPVVAPVPTLDGRLRVEVDRASLALQPVIEAPMLDVDDHRLVAAAGAALADLHLALAAYPETGTIRALCDKPESLSSRLVSTGDDTPPECAFSAQLVHNDFRSANILCGKSTVVAILDFEEVFLEYRVADLAKAAVFLGTLYRDWGPVSQRTRETFFDGYRATSPLSVDEEAWLRLLVEAKLSEIGWVSAP